MAIGLEDFYLQRFLTPEKYRQITWQKDSTQIRSHKMVFGYNKANVDVNDKIDNDTADDGDDDSDDGDNDDVCL